LQVYVDAATSMPDPSPVPIERGGGLDGTPPEGRSNHGHPEQ
jgi:hypothetical protein